MKVVTDGDILWTPTKEQIEQSSVKKYMDWLKEKKGLHLIRMRRYENGRSLRH